MTRISIVTALALTAVAVAGVVLVLNRRHAEWDKQMRENSKSMAKSPYSSVIAQQLDSYDGEDSVMRHAFEEALDVETRLEQQLARETGLEA